MSFLSLEFGIFMLLVISVYFVIPKRYQWILLLIASYLFYASNGLGGLVFLVLTTVIIFVAALLVEKRQAQLAERTKNADADQKKREKALCQKHKRFIVAGAVTLTLGILVIVKYSEFVFGNLNAALSLMRLGVELPIPDLIKPLGISYFTLQAIGYLFEVYRGKTKAEHNLARFALYISYFPQVIQGPFNKYQDLVKTLYGPHSFDYRRARSGALRIMWGCFKKLIVAMRIGVIFGHVLGPYQDPSSGGVVILLTFLLYGFQVYADFSGGIDITLGISEILGIELAENFRQPYFARSVAEFWQRWHMTLGTWMRNYVFYPLALSKPFNKLGRALRGKVGAHAAKIIPTSIASFIVFLLVGIWHGTGYKYAAYGLYQAVFVSTATLLEPFYARCRARLHIREDSKTFILFQMLRTIMLITIGRYLSAANSLLGALRLYRCTFTRGLCLNMLLDWETTFGLDIPDTLCMLAGILIMLAVDWFNEKDICIRKRVLDAKTPVRWAFYIAALYSIIIFGMYGKGFDASAFIYERF